MQDIIATDINAMKSLLYLQPNDYIYIKPLNKILRDWKETGMRISKTIITVLSLAATTFTFKRIKTA
jgi:polysaccharide export outer membrane protein